MNENNNPDSEIKSKGFFKKKDYEKIEAEMEASEETDKTDEDILLNPQKELAGGIETEEFDIIPNFETTKEEMQKLEEKKGIDIEYTFNGDEVKEGLKLFQKQTIYKRNIIYTALLLLFFTLYMVRLIKDPTQTLSYFLSVMCIALVGTIWYMPFSHIRKTAKAADDNQLAFTMSVYDDCIKIGEENGSFILKYNTQIKQIYETVKLFLICAGKERMFILPKRCLKDGVSTELRELWGLVMETDYIKKM